MAFSFTMFQRSCFVLTLLCFSSAIFGQDKPDTLVIGGITVIRDNKVPTEEVSHKSFFKKINTQKRTRRVSTEWGIVDLGVSNWVDDTHYPGSEAQAFAPGANEEWFGIRPFKSRNVNIWLITQRYNLIHHVVNLQYGLGLELNNYFFEQPVRYDPNPSAVASSPTIVYLDPKASMVPSQRTFKKNKLAADYVTVPLMLNFNFTPHRLYPFELSAGISVGYLYSARNKRITSDEGKQKSRDDFELDNWKLSYVGDLTLGVVTFYGSYAFKNMYKRGLDHTPYNFGIRLRPMDLFNKIDFQ